MLSATPKYQYLALWKIVTAFLNPLHWEARQFYTCKYYMGNLVRCNLISKYTNTFNLSVTFACKISNLICWSVCTQIFWRARIWPLWRPMASYPLEGEMLLYHHRISTIPYPLKILDPGLLNNTYLRHSSGNQSFSKEWPKKWLSTLKWMRLDNKPGQQWILSRDLG